MQFSIKRQSVSMLMHGPIPELAGSDHAANGDYSSGNSHGFEPVHDMPADLISHVSGSR